VAFCPSDVEYDSLFRLFEPHWRNRPRSDGHGYNHSARKLAQIYCGPCQCKSASRCHQTRLEIANSMWIRAGVAATLIFIAGIPPASNSIYAAGPLSLRYSPDRHNGDSILCIGNLHVSTALANVRKHWCCYCRTRYAVILAFDRYADRYLGGERPCFQIRYRAFHCPHCISVRACAVPEASRYPSGDTGLAAKFKSNPQIQMVAVFTGTVAGGDLKALSQPTF